MHDKEFEDFILRKYKSKLADTRAYKRIDVEGNSVKFNLTFDEYFNLFAPFKDDYRLYEGKTSKDQLVLCRNKDLGSYEIDNVYIATRSQNNKDQTNRVMNITEEMRSAGGKSCHEKYPELANQNLNSEQAVEKKVKTFKKIKHRQGAKNSQFGTMWITDGQNNKKINKDDYQIWIGTGWYKGRKI